ncbi:NUDIX domain-containing protein [Deinococcus aerolatus]|nr:NUDIX hydrolase [Deinococcus aerolatus]
MTGDARTIYDGHILKLELLEDKWEVIRHADAVAVLALNDAGEMLLVRQFRRAVNAHTLEAPAGLIDGEELPEAAARRELQEEAGLDGEVRLLTRFYASPGFCDELLYVFQATGLRESKLPHDEDEDIEVVWMAPQKVLDGMREGRIVGSASTLAAALYGVQSLNASGAAAHG